MHHARQVSRCLDDEHRAALDLLGRAERAFARDAPDEWAALARPLVRQLEHEVGRHFTFEEEALFPRLADAGDADLAVLLEEEHGQIRDVTAELLPLVRAVEAGTLPAAERPALRRLVLELVERQVAHIQKETLALLPMLDDLLDDEADRQLALAYAGD